MTRPLDLHQLDRAVATCNDPEFRVSWQALHDACPWSTPFQDPLFVTNWYDAYKNDYSPILVCQLNSDGHLDGLLPLALSKDRHSLTVAGAENADYKVWISRNESSSFIESALEKIISEYPGYELIFDYLPASTPIKTLVENSRLAPYCILTTHKLPVMQINSERLLASFRKKSNKSRFNRLKQLGELKLEKVTDVDSFTRLLDALIPQHDFRHSAIHNTAYLFRSDPALREFLLAVFQSSPLLHVTALLIDDEIIGIHIGFAGMGRLYLGFFTYALKFSLHSPGKLHLMLLGKDLVDDGIEFLDLTPGGDPYKDRFADFHENIFHLRFFTSSASRTKYRLIQTGINLIKNGCKLLHTSPVQLRKLLQRIKLLKLADFNIVINSLSGHNSEVSLYHLETADTVFVNSAEVLLEEDNLETLLEFEATEFRHLKQEFLSSSLHRLENGQHVYTYYANNRLVFYCWLIRKSGEVYLPTADRKITIEEDGILIYDIYCHPRFSSEIHYDAIVSNILNEIAAGSRHLYLATNSNNKAFIKAIESIGLFQQITFS